MRVAGVLIGITFLATATLAQKYPCLQSDVKEDFVVSSVTITSSKGEVDTKQITVGQTLEQLKARCSTGKLIDGKGKLIYFYKLQGCWGNPPADYLEILDNQRKDIEKLKETYTVVEITCTPVGVPLQSISKLVK